MSKSFFDKSLLEVPCKHLWGETELSCYGTECSQMLLRSFSHFLRFGLNYNMAIELLSKEVFYNNYLSS